MSGSKTKILALCALALAVMAVSAGAAQAETGAFWLVNGAKISTTLNPELAIEQEGTGKLLAKLGANTFHITCAAAEAAAGSHLTEPNGGLIGKIKFTGCKFFNLTKGGAGEELKECEPLNGSEKGVIVTSEIKGLILLHEPAGVREQVIDIEPVTGTTLAKIFIGDECAIGESINIAGKLVVKDCEGKALTDLVKHLVEELKALSSLTVNGNAANTASLDASAWIKLKGAHAGRTFAAHS